MPDPKNLSGAEKFNYLARQSIAQELRHVRGGKPYQYGHAPTEEFGKFTVSETFTRPPAPAGQRKLYAPNREIRRTTDKLNLGLLQNSRTLRALNIKQLTTGLSKAGKVSVRGLPGIAAGLVGDIADIKEKKGYARTPEAKGAIPTRRSLGVKGQGRKG